MAISFVPGQVIPAPEWEAIFAQHGGPKGTPSRRSPTKDEQRSADDDGDDLDQNPIYRYYAGDDSYVEARRAPNGDYLIVAYHPSPKFQQTQREAEKPETGARRPANAVPNIEGTPLPGGGYDNSRPIKVWRTPDGQQAGPPEELTEGERKRWEQEKNQAAGRGYKTDAEVNSPKPTEAGEASETKPVEGRSGWRQVTTKVVKDGKSVQETYYLDPEGKRHETLPGQATTASASDALDGHPGWRVVKRASKDAQGNATTETVYVDPQGKEHATPPEKPGKKYTQVTQDKETGKWYGLTPEGTWEEMPGGPGAPTGAGATPGAGLPQIILGQSEQAIRTMDAQNAELVAAGRMTPAQRANRLQEAFQLAQIAQTDAQIRQRQLESARNAGFNIASTRLDFFGSGLTNAMKFAMEIASKARRGSGAGGKAFAALLGMQLMIARDSGIMDLEIPDEALTPEARARRAEQRASLPRPRLTDPADPIKVDADLEQTEAGLTRAVAAPTTTDAGGAPAPAAPPPTGAAGDMVVVEQVDAAGRGGRKLRVTRAEAAEMSQAQSPGMPPLWRIVEAPAPAPAPATAQPPAAPAPAPPAPLPTSPGAYLTPPGMTSPNPPDVTETRPVNPPAGEPGRPERSRMDPTGGPVDQMEADYPVLQRFAPPPQIPEPSPLGFDPVASPALLRSLAASVPPWRLSADDIERMRAAGIDEQTIWSVPRVGVTA